MITLEAGDILKELQTEEYRNDPIAKALIYIIEQMEEVPKKLYHFTNPVDGGQR